ncbi:MAG TPA: DMT family transporter [Victivallales bacterium]|nr:DMT family transporter [Victivallales bacterium]
MNIQEIKVTKKDFNSSIAILFIATFFWGSTYIFSKILIGYFSVNNLLLYRSFLSIFLLYIFFYKSINKDFYSACQSPMLWLFATAGCIALFSQTIALKYTSASNAAFITALFIVFVPILRFIHYKSKITLKFYTAVLIAFAGIYFISFGFDKPTHVNRGDLLALISAFCYAYYTVSLEKISKEFHESTIIFFSFAFIAFIALIINIISTESYNIVMFENPFVILNFLALVILGGIIPYMLMAKGQKFVPSNIASLVYNFEPLFATMLACIFLKETVTIPKIIGGSAIFIALLAGTHIKRENKL